MTNSRNKALLLALCAATAATTLSAVVPAAATAPGAGAPLPRLAWHPCAKPGGPATQECADLPVPLDYANPGGPQITVAVSRVRSDRPEARRGTLVVIPGGPGGSGVQRLTQKGAALQKQLAGAYDLVAFDPRGVGGSTTASCGLAPGDRYLTSLRAWPAPNGDISENVARSERIAEACARNGGPVLRSFTTANEVADMDRLREVLGERKISAWGVSYGTYVGAVYAQKHPERTDRWVLDSSGDPDPTRLARGWLANMGQGADDRFPDFAAWAAHPDRDRDGLRLAADPRDVEPQLLALAASLDRAPRPSTTPGVPLTGNGLRQAVQNALYGDSAFPALAKLLVSLRDPAATPSSRRSWRSRCATRTPPSWSPCSATTWPGRARAPPRASAPSTRTGPATPSPRACPSTCCPAPTGRTPRSRSRPGSPRTVRPTSSWSRAAVTPPRPTPRA